MNIKILHFRILCYLELDKRTLTLWHDALKLNVCSTVNFTSPKWSYRPLKPLAGYIHTIMANSARHVLVRRKKKVKF